MITRIMNRPRSAIVLSVFAFVIIVIGIAVLVLQSTTGTESAPMTIVPVKRISPPSAAVIKQLQQSHGFQAFVSYTNGSFQPATTTIKVGQTIRFTNNSTHDIWVGQITAKNTPANPNTQTCDVPFNSCHALHPGDFAEFTFPATGTFYFMDDLSTATRGAVIVK
jgi:plastocyanin